MNRKKLLYGVILAAVVIGWAAFRPERLFVNSKINESMPMASASGMPEKTLASGTFHSVAHSSAGNASIYQLADGRRILRFTNFQTSNGPDVRVYLVGANDATDNATVTQSGFREIAPLKGNIGDQNYELSSDVDLTKYHAVTIWCKRFSVNFATAPLSPAGPMASNN
ncbi:MAG TPA: DM13 domain-containing protein [Terriglobales bacterium]|nr:DM13 domain-containing protein [Terriglobales bacterium]